MIEGSREREEEGFALCILQLPTAVLNMLSECLIQVVSVFEFPNILKV